MSDTQPSTTPVRFAIMEIVCRWCKAPIEVEIDPNLSPGEQLTECEKQAEEKHSCPQNAA